MLVVIGIGIAIFGRGFLHRYLEGILPVFYLGLMLNIFCVTFMTILVFHPLFAKAILCNICVCLAVWCSIKMKTETGKIMMAVLGVMTFVTSGYEHSVANMTFFTIGLLDPGTAITIGGVLYNLLIVTAGNMLGGILFVALPYYLIQKEK